MRRKACAIALAVAVLAAACGGDDDSGVAFNDAGEVTLVSADARWLGPDIVLDRFDVSEQKLDPDVLGVVATWEYETSNADPTVRPQVEAVVVIDGQRSITASYLGARTPSSQLRDAGGLTLTQTEGGFKLNLVLGNIVGASDLTDPDEFAEFASAAGLDAEELGYDPADFFISDSDEDGLLSYLLRLDGTIEVDGVEIEPPPPIEFEAFESDPDAVAVPDSVVAVAEAESQAIAEEGECDPTLVIVDEQAVTVAAPGAPVVELVLPDGWTAEQNWDDPCLRSGVQITLPDERRSTFGLLVWALESETLDEYVDRFNTDLNFFDIDEEDNELFLQPGDEGYNEAEPIVEEEFQGRRMLRARISQDLGDFVLRDEFLWIDGGTHTIRLTHTLDDDGLAPPQLPDLLEAITITG